MIADADRSLNWAHSDLSDGCLRWSKSLLGTQWSGWWLPTLISVFTGHTVIGVMAAYADLSLYWAHSDRSDGCVRWPQSLLGTQWSKWWLRTLISVFTGNRVIGVMAAYADLSLYLAHSDRSDGCVRWSQSLLGTEWSKWMAAYADLSLYWAHSNRSDGCLRWS